MKPTGSFIARTARLFNAIALLGLLEGCRAPIAGRQDLNDAQSKAARQTDADPDDYSEIPPDERPFSPVHLDGKTYLTSQANNLYIYPAVGLTIHVTKANRVTDEMFIDAAHAVADQVTPEQLKLGMLFPPQSNILATEIKTAERVAELVVKRPKDLHVLIELQLYAPEYRRPASSKVEPHSELQRAA